MFFLCRSVSHASSVTAAKSPRLQQSKAAESGQRLISQMTSQISSVAAMSQQIESQLDNTPLVSCSLSHYKTIIVRPTAVRAISTDIICQTIFQHCRTSDLELTATCCIKLRLSLYFQIKT